MCSKGQCQYGHFSLHWMFSEKAVSWSLEVTLYVQIYMEHIQEQQLLMAPALSVFKRSVSAWIIQLALTIFWNSSYMFMRCQTTCGAIHKAYPQAAAINDSGTWLCVQEVSAWRLQFALKIFWKSTCLIAVGGFRCYSLLDIQKYRHNKDTHCQDI